jgi:predicted Ser/Thr protein kinase
MKIYVRSKKDRDALLKVFERVYEWIPPIENLGVEHRELDRAIEGIPPDDSYISFNGTSKF